jgi:hypothetical protein
MAGVTAEFPHFLAGIGGWGGGGGKVGASIDWLALGWWVLDRSEVLAVW